MKKRILVLAANPKRESYVNQLASTYAQSAEANHQVQLMYLADMDFNQDLSEGYAEELSLEAPLKAFQAAIQWCDHLVIIAPVWWGGLPAKLKGLFDRTFLPGFAFKYEKGSLIPRKLLKDKTARIILTMDTPPWYYRLVQGAPAIRQLKTATLKFVGFTSVKSDMIGPIINSSQQNRSKWLDQVSGLGSVAG